MDQHKIWHQDVWHVCSGNWWGVKLIIPGAKQGVKKSKVSKNAHFRPLFNLSDPQLSSIIMKTSRELENYHTSVNLLVKFCRDVYSEN